MQSIFRAFLFAVAVSFLQRRHHAQALDVLDDEELSGTLSGTIRLLGSAVVPQGQTLIISPGTIVDAAQQTAGLEVYGTLILRGSSTGSQERITFSSSSTASWEGIVVYGEMKGSGLDVRGAKYGILGQPGSSISLYDTTIAKCGTTVRLSNGGSFDNSTLIGGNSIVVEGGILRMTDTLVDFEHSGQPPDCTRFNGGGAVLDHVRFTGCHCPLHWNAATDEVTVTNSVFDLAAYPAMVARMKGTFTGNHFLMNGGIAIFRGHMLDIGGSLDLDISENYWGGGAPKLLSTSQQQFRGADLYSREPFPGVGPRI